MLFSWRPLRLVATIGLVMSLATLAPAALGSDAAEVQFELANTRYKNGNYEDAAGILRKLLGVPIDPVKEKDRAKIYRQARPILVACLFGIAAVVDVEQAKTLHAEADAVILEQYRQDPFFKVAAGFSQEVTDAWTRVFFEHSDELEALQAKRITDQQRAAELAAKEAKAIADRVERLEEMAAEERFVDTRSRVVAMVPFGVGQFQNDDIGLGVFFAASETLVIATSIVSWIVAQDIKDTKCPDDQEIDGQVFKVDCDQLMTNFEAARAVNYTALATTGALMISGIIQAQIAFEPERVTVRKRPIPPPVRVAPVGVVTPEGAYFGLTGSF
jgi:hypothetical protein